MWYCVERHLLGTPFRTPEHSPVGPAPPGADHAVNFDQARPPRLFMLPSVGELLCEFVESLDGTHVTSVLHQSLGVSARVDTLHSPPTDARQTPRCQPLCSSRAPARSQRDLERILHSCASRCSLTEYASCSARQGSTSSACVDMSWMWSYVLFNHEDGRNA